MRATPSSSWSWLGWGSCGHPHTWSRRSPAAASREAPYSLHLSNLWPCHCNTQCTGPGGPGTSPTPGPGLEPEAHGSAQCSGALAAWTPGCSSQQAALQRNIRPCIFRILSLSSLFTIYIFKNWHLYPIKHLGFQLNMTYGTDAFYLCYLLASFCFSKKNWKQWSCFLCDKKPGSRLLF